MRGTDYVPQGDHVDSHVLGGGGASAAGRDVRTISFLSLCMMKNGVSSLAVKEVMAVNDLEGPAGVTVLPDKSLVVACKDSNCVSSVQV